MSLHRSSGLRIASVCSSVGGFDLGMHRAGHRTVAFCEIEPYRRQVLERHWPGVPIHHDLKRLQAHDLPEFDLLIGGTPCQDLSNAGLGAGLDGERSGLFHAFAQLRIDAYEHHGARYSVWENVAGALSSNQGRDFATVLSSHVGAEVPVPRRGWGRAGGGWVVGPWGAAEWRLLDAQFFGVPQRRRRVFVVGHLGADRPLEVLTDRARRGGHLAPGAEARPQPARRSRRGAPVAGSLTVASALDCKRGGVDDNDAQARHIVAAPLLARDRKGVSSDVEDGSLVVNCVTGQVTHALTANGHDASEDGTGRGAPIIAQSLTAGHGKPGTNPAGRRQEDDVNLAVTSTLTSQNRPGSATEQVVAFHMTQDPITGDVSPALGTNMSVGVSFAENQRGEVVEAPITPALSTGGGKPGQGYPAVRTHTGVRRLTPTERERLMGWPDSWTLLHGPSLADAPQSWPAEDRSPLDLKPDGRRDAASGDGVVAHVAEWIGHGFNEAAPVFMNPEHVITNSEEAADAA